MALYQVGRPGYTVQTWEQLQYFIPQICQPHYQVERSIPESYQSILAEQDSGCPAGGLGELGKYYPSHAGLDRGV